MLCHFFMYFYIIHLPPRPSRLTQDSSQWSLSAAESTTSHFIFKMRMIVLCLVFVHSSEARFTEDAKQLKWQLAIWHQTETVNPKTTTLMCLYKLTWWDTNKFPWTAAWTSCTNLYIDVKSSYGDHNCFFFLFLFLFFFLNQTVGH